MASQYVGIDLHRRRSAIVREDADRQVLEQVRIDNDPVALALAVERAGPNPEVVIEATYGWYWAVDVLEAVGATVPWLIRGGEGVKLPEGEERHRRRDRSDGSAAHEPAAGGVDRPTGAAPAA